MKQRVFSSFIGKMMVVLGVLLVLTTAFVFSGGASTAHAKASYDYVGVLPSGASLGVDQTIASPSGVYVLKLQEDGNLVLRENGGYVWDTHSNGSGGATFNAAMQLDGNFVIYCHGNGCWTYRSIYSSCTDGDKYSHLEVQDDGNVVVYTQSHRAVWARTWGYHC